MHEALAKEENEPAFELSFDLMNIYGINEEEVCKKINELNKRRV